MIVLTTATALLLQASGLRLDPAAAIFFLAIGVVAIGLPHGGLDHLIGQELFKTWVPRSHRLTFFATYFGIALAVVAAWIWIPTTTVAIFFILSAWHFGKEEDERHISNWLIWLAMVVRGGMVIWIPATFQGGEIVQILATVMPNSDTETAFGMVRSIQIFSPVCFVLLLMDLLWFRDPSSKRTWGISLLWQHRLRVVAFGLLFAVSAPLISFGIYFCGWHSIRGLIHLYRDFDAEFRRFVWSVAPISALAVMLLTVGFLFSRTALPVTSAMVQTVFIGLSAVAIPHLLLHILADSQNWRPIAKLGAFP